MQRRARQASLGLTLLLTLALASVAAARDDGGVKKPSVPPRARGPHYFQPPGSSRLALVPVPPNIKPRVDSRELKPMDRVPLRGISGKKKGWLWPEKLRSKLVKTADDAGLKHPDRRGLYVLLPCKITGRVWVDDTEGLPPELKPCFRRADKPGSKENAEGIVVAFDATEAGARRRLAQRGFRTDKLYPAILIGGLRSIRDLEKRLNDHVGLLLDPDPLSSVGTVATGLILIDPKIHPIRKKTPKRPRRGG